MPALREIPFDEIEQGSLAWSLLYQHSINGSFRNKGDVDISKFHVHRTLDFAITLFRDVEGGTVEEKIAFLEREKEEVEKLGTKQPDHG